MMWWGGPEHGSMALSSAESFARIQPRGSVESGVMLLMESEVSSSVGNIPCSAMTLVVNLFHQRFCVGRGIFRLFVQWPWLDL